GLRRYSGRCIRRAGGRAQCLPPPQLMVTHGPRGAARRLSAGTQDDSRRPPHGSLEFLSTARPAVTATSGRRTTKAHLRRNFWYTSSVFLRSNLLTSGSSCITFRIASLSSARLSLSTWSKSSGGYTGKGTTITHPSVIRPRKSFAGSIISHF